MDKILSLIVPSYNMEAYLPKCLESLIIADKELLQKLDVIVVNDGSKDRTSEIAHEFESKYQGVFRVIDKLNGHYGSCVNAALEVAKGQYVKMLDADDSYDTKAFAIWVRHIDNLNGQGVLIDLHLTDFVSVDEGGKVTGYERFNFPQKTAFEIDDERYAGELYPMHSIAYRTQLLRDIGYEQTEGVSYTDVEWVLYPAPYIKTAYYWPNAVYKYLLGRAGQSVSKEVLIRDAKQSYMVNKKLIGRYSYISAVEGKVDRGAFYINWLARLLRTRYTAVIIDGLGDEGLLKMFDADLRNASHEIYEFIGRMKYSKRVPWMFVRAWRRNSWVLYFMPIICRLYSVVASKVWRVSR